MKRYIISVDRGSTNVKAVVFDTAGEEVLVSSCASQKPVSIRPGWWEQDMQIIWESTASAIKTIFEQGIRAKEVLGVFVSGQGNGLMPIDKYGQPSRMGILSLDSRATGILAKWMADGRYDQVLRENGMPLAVGSPLPLLAWFRENSPEEFAAIDKVLFSKDWVNYKLCGIIGTDPTDASGAGMMNIRENRYSYEIFEKLGLSDITEKLPEIHPSHQILGKVTKEAAVQTGLREGTPVLGGSHDIAAFPYGVGTIDSKQWVCIVGTWGMNLHAVTSPDGQPAAFYHTCPGYYLSGAGDGNSGGCQDIMLDILYGAEKDAAAAQGKSIYEYVENLIEEHKETQILFQPYLFGNSISRVAGAGFYGIKNWHSKEDWFKAVLEGIVMGHLANMRGLPGYEEIAFIWLIGGGAKSRVLGQLFADISGKPVRIAVTSEITARGGALNALVGLGICKSHEEAAIPVRMKREYRPESKRHEFYKKKFEIFCEASEANVKIWEKLNDLCSN